MRLASLFDVKKNSETIEELLGNKDLQGVPKTRRDKLAGDPIWVQAWHHFMDLKKGQSFRCKISKSERIKDPASGKWVWQTKWLRHQKRYMSMSIDQFHTEVLKWEPYLKW